MSQSSATFDPISGTEHGGVGFKAVGACSNLTLANMMGFHAVTDFGDLSICIAVHWNPVALQDGNKKKTKQAHWRHPHV